MRVKVIGRPLGVQSGILLGLNEEQASARSHALKRQGGKYLTTAQTMFKVGEELDYPDPDKAMLQFLEPLDAADKDARRPSKPSEPEMKHPKPDVQLPNQAKPGRPLSFSQLRGGGQSPAKPAAAAAEAGALNKAGAGALPVGGKKKAAKLI